MANAVNAYKGILQTNYYEYVKCVHGKRWKDTQFHRYLCRRIQDFLETDTGNAYDILIIATPPQHGKSSSVTETLPSWYLGKNPLNRVIEISYSEDFAQKFGRRNKEKVKTYGQELFGIELASSPNSTTEFELSNGVGGMISRGVLSGVTGQPCDLMIIDDPIKNRQEADSETTRARIFDEWQNSFKTRFGAKSKIILIMTRWHEDDLAGKILETERNVTYIRLPVEAEEDDLLGRSIGEPLCPELGKDSKWLKEFKSSYVGENGSRAWNALYQGRPTAQTGNMFKRKWWKMYEELPQIEKWVMSVDAAFKDDKRNDFVAIQVWGKTGANMYLIDAVKKHLDLPQTMREIIRLRSMYEHCKITLIEDKANGSAIISMLRKSLTGIIAVQPVGGKVSRANAILGAIESGNVWLPANKPFTWDFVDECASFPLGKHDDQVDAMTQGLNRLIYQSADPTVKEKLNALERLFPMYRKKRSSTGIGRKEKVRVI